MKALVTICRIIVGLLFIFSGLVKANDPHGLSYKMQEFFEIWHLSKFDSWTLLLSVLMNAFEIIAGFALLLGWRIKLFIWLLLLLILFFTFLTGYTYVTGKPTNCGCFGDCLPITSKTSFLKDVVLTILIGFLLWQRQHIKPLFSVKLNTILMALVTVLSFGMQWYALNYLPFVDCLPFKKGNNISEKMKMPANAVPDKVEITFKYIKDGQVVRFPVDSIPETFDKKEYVVAKDDSEDLPDGTSRVLKVFVKGGTEVEFNAASFPADFSSQKYILIDRYEKMLVKGSNNEPPIKGFALSGVTNVDSTQIVLAEPAAILLFCENFATPFSKWKTDFDKIHAQAQKRNIPVYVVTSSMAEAAATFGAYPNTPVFKCDYTAIRTAARVNPTLYLLEKGTVMGKWSYKQFGSALSAVEKQPVQPKEETPPAITEPVNADSAGIKPDSIQ